MFGTGPCFFFFQGKCNCVAETWSTSWSSILHVMISVVTSHERGYSALRGSFGALLDTAFPPLRGRFAAFYNTFSNIILNNIVLIGDPSPF